MIDMLNWKRRSSGSDVNATHVVETDSATQVTEHKSFVTISLTSTVTAQCSARPALACTSRSHISSGGCLLGGDGRQL